MVRCPEKGFCSLKLFVNDHLHDDGFFSFCELSFATYLLKSIMNWSMNIITTVSRSSLPLSLWLLVFKSQVCLYSSWMQG